MQASKMRRSTRQMIDAIEGLDLGPIKFKLMDPEEGEGWTRELVEHMETQYKRYLTLVAKFPRETIAPGKDVDRFWHAHILDTRKYIDDFTDDTGWTPRATESIAGALQYREYDFATRLLMRLLMRRGGHPTDSSHDYVYTDWDAVDRFGRECAAMAGGVEAGTPS